MNSGLHDTGHLTLNLKKYPQLPFREIIASNNPVYKAFGIIDRRLGKRRFKRIEVNEHDHALVKRFYLLRKETFERDTRLQGDIQ